MRINSFFPRLFLVLVLAGAGMLTAFVTAPWQEYGKAGYYADSLHGRKTASGEKYDKNELTCAHKTLAFGTKVRVTRLDNDKSVVVRVNDRGPFADGYVVDLSRKAAEQIGLIRDGFTRVKVEVLDDTPARPARSERVSDPLPERQSQARPASAEPASATAAPAPAAAAKQGAILIKRHDTKSPSAPATYSQEDPKPSTVGRTVQPAQASPRNDQATSELYQVSLSRPVRRGFGVQVATLTEVENALRELEKAQKNFPNQVMLNMESTGDPAVRPDYKIILGPFENRKAAEARQKSALKKGYRKCFIVDLTEI